MPQVNLPLHINGKPGRPFPLNIIAPEYVVPQSSGASVPICDASGLDWLAESCNEHIRQRFDCPIGITGKRRMGKSSFGMHLARRLNPRFSIDQIAFTLDDYENLIRNTDPANSPVYMYDEAIEGMFKQEWQRQIGIVKTLNISGALYIKHLLIMPSLGDFNSKIKPMMNFWIYIEDRGLAIVEESSVDKHTGAVWWTPILAISYPPFTEPLWDEYQEKKQRFMTSFKTDVPTKRVQKLTDQRNVCIRWLYDHGHTQEEIAQRLEMTQQSISQILHS